MLYLLAGLPAVLHLLAGAKGPIIIKPGDFRLPIFDFRFSIGDCAFSASRRFSAGSISDC
jgi:hypothetical protein